MTRKVRRRSPAPFAWRGALSEIEFTRRQGADVVVDGTELLVEGVEIPPLWRWFDRSQPLWAEPVARVFCHCGSGPIAAVERLWQNGRESVARITYQQRAHVGDGREMLRFRAVLHPKTEHCRHGRLVMHPEEFVTVHCRLHDSTLTGMVVVRSVIAAGGWSGSTDREPPRVRRVVLPH